jgi:hypothetical protein
MKCNKEELRPPGAAPRGPRKNQRPGGTHRPQPPGRPEPASQEPRKQPPATMYIFFRSVLRLTITANVVRSSPILVTLMMEVTRSSETSVPTRATRRNIPEDGIPHGDRRNWSASHRSLYSHYQLDKRLVGLVALERI